MDDTKKAWKSFAEEMEVSSKHLLTEIHRLIAEGNVRKLVVKSDDGHVFLTIPLTAGAVAGGILTLLRWVVLGNAAVRRWGIPLTTEESIQPRPIGTLRE